MSKATFAAALFVSTLAALPGCKPTVCGDGYCDLGEGCGSCSRDCGMCSGGFAGPYEECSATRDCENSRDTCVFVRNGSVTRGMCTVAGCPGSATSADDVCEFDMFSSRGDCLSFGSGDGFNCYHRCRTSSDCPRNFGCYNPLGASGALTMVCLPE
jgi:hypothetical protein